MRAITYCVWFLVGAAFAKSIPLPIVEVKPATILLSVITLFLLILVLHTPRMSILEGLVLILTQICGAMVYYFLFLKASNGMPLEILGSVSLMVSVSACGLAANVAIWKK